MSELTPKGRAQLSEGNFALPGRRYPIHDAAHARNALARVAQHGTPAEKKRVQAAVHARYPSIGEEKSAAVSAMGLPMPAQTSMTGGGGSLMSRRPTGGVSSAPSIPGSNFASTGPMLDRPWLKEGSEAALSSLGLRKQASAGMALLSDVLGAAARPAAVLALNHDAVSEPFERALGYADKKIIEPLVRRRHAAALNDLAREHGNADANDFLRSHRYGEAVTSDPRMQAFLRDRERAQSMASRGVIGSFMAPNYLSALIDPQHSILAPVAGHLGANLLHRYVPHTVATDFIGNLAGRRLARAALAGVDHYTKRKQERTQGDSHV